MTYYEKAPNNAIFQFWEGDDHQLSNIYAQDGEYLGSVVYENCNLPEAAYQVFNPVTHIWTVKLKNGKFIDGLKPNEKFYDIPEFPYDSKSYLFNQ